MILNHLGSPSLELRKNGKPAYQSQNYGHKDERVVSHDEKHEPVGQNHLHPIEHTLEEIGRMMHITKERIRQIEARAIRKLRHPSRCKTLKHFKTIPYNKG